MIDKLKLIVAVLVLAAGIGAYYYLADDFSTLQRTLMIVASVVAAGIISAMSAPGRGFIGFVREARTEVRKVVWPSRKETLQTAAMVIVMVIILSLFLWMIDSILFWLVGKFTGQGG